MRAIETTGRIKDPHHLLLDGTVPFPVSEKVKVIVLFNEAKDELDEVPESIWLKVASVNPVFSDLHDPAEDLYSLDDGKPFSG